MLCCRTDHATAARKDLGGVDAGACELDPASCEPRLPEEQSLVLPPRLDCQPQPPASCCLSGGGTVASEFPLSVHRQELRELLDDWGHTFLQVLNGPLHGPTGAMSTELSEENAMVSRQHTGRTSHTAHSAIRPRFDTAESKNTAASSSRRREDWSVLGGFSSRTGLVPVRGRSKDTNRSAASSMIKSAEPVSHILHKDTNLSATSSMYKSSEEPVSHILHKVSRPWETTRMHKGVFGPDYIQNSRNVATAGKPQPKWRERLIRLVSSRPFECLCAVAVVANAVLIGWLSDYRMLHMGQPSPMWASTAESVFATMFTIEVVLKLLAHGPAFFCSEFGRWNTLDFVLVLHSLTEALTSSEDEGVIANSSFLRMLRLTKMLRILRIIRFLRGFRELRLITNSILGSATAMCWSAVLLFFVTFLFGVCFLQACTLFLERAEPSAEEEALVRQYWGSIFSSMLSLFMATTGGEDWNALSAPLWSVSPALYCSFLVYIAFFLFCIINAITSLFVEATMKFSAQDNFMAICLELEKKDKHIADLQEFFQELDADDDGHITYDDFSAMVFDARLQAFASSLGIDAYDTLATFKMLSGSLNRKVDLETFVIGCIKLQGEAKAVDMYSLFDQQKDLTHQVRTTMESLESQVNIMRRDLQAASCAASSAGQTSQVHWGAPLSS